MNENAVKIPAVTQPEPKRWIPLDSSSESSSLPSHPEDMALTEELCSLDWLQTENLLPGTIMPARKAVNQKPLIRRACLQTVCSAGCLHSLDERINEDLHPLSWLQDSNLLPISPIDEEEDLPLNSNIQPSSAQKVPDSAEKLASPPVIFLPRERLRRTSPNSSPFPRLRVRLPNAASATVSTVRPTNTVLTLAKTIEKDSVSLFLSSRPTNLQRSLSHPACVSTGVTNLPARSSLCPRRRVNTEVEEELGVPSAVFPLKRARKTFLEKPLFTYAQLAFMAIESSPSKALEFSQIWEWCKDSFPAYDIGSRLKTCLRHILSSNASFQRVPQGQGRLSQWRIRPEMKPRLLHSLRFIAIDTGRALSPDVERLLQQAEESFLTPEHVKIASPLDPLNHLPTRAGP